MRRRQINVMNQQAQEKAKANIVVVEPLNKDSTDKEWAEFAAKLEARIIEKVQDMLASVDTTKKAPSVEVGSCGKECHKCKKEFKSKSGAISHMKACKA